MSVHHNRAFAVNYSVLQGGLILNHGLRSSSNPPTSWYPIVYRYVNEGITSQRSQMILQAASLFREERRIFVA
eukprot:1336018-Amphidinium_carterae.1